MGKVATQDDLVSRIIALEAQVKQLSTSTLGTSAVRNNVTVYDNAGNAIVILGVAPDGRVGLVINDTSGNPQVRLGQLAAGGYGLEAISPVDGTLTPLSSYIFGPQTASVATDESLTSASYSDLATVGPQVTVNVPSTGRVLVLWGCEARFDDNTSNGAMGAYVSVALSGANTLAPSDSWRCGFYQQQLNTTSNNIEWHGAQIHVFSGLTPGNTTFTMKYRNFDGTKTARFISRTIAVHLF